MTNPDYKVKRRKRGSLVSQFARDESIENSRHNRREEMIKVIAHQLEHLKDEQEERYLGWLEKSLTKGEVVIEEKDLSFQSTGAEKAEGQRFNVRKTAAVCLHLPSGMGVRREDRAEQIFNREEAREVLIEKLREHLGLWQKYMETFVAERPEVQEIFKEIKLMRE